MPFWPDRFHMETVRSGASAVPFVGPLDAYTANLAVCWSIWRRLLSTYDGPLIRIRRSSDNAELDIYATVEGFLDVVALLAFVGSNSAFIKTIYAQDGSGLDYIQLSASAQRRIVNAGTVDMVDGVPCGVVTTDNGQGYVTATTSTYSGTAFSAFTFGSFANSSSYNRAVSAAKDAGVDYGLTGINPFGRTANSQAAAIEVNTYLASLPITYDAPFIASSILDGSNATLRIGALSSSAAFSGALSINRYLLGQVSSSVIQCGAGDHWAEGIVYLADKTADEAAIRSLMNP